MAGRFLPQKDREFFERINKELVGDLKRQKEGIINQTIVIHKISPLTLLQLFVSLDRIDKHLLDMV